MIARIWARVLCMCILIAKIKKCNNIYLVLNIYILICFILYIQLCEVTMFNSALGIKNDLFSSGQQGGSPTAGAEQSNNQNSLFKNYLTDRFEDMLLKKTEQNGSVHSYEKEAMEPEGDSFVSSQENTQGQTQKIKEKDNTTQSINNTSGLQVQLPEQYAQNKNTELAGNDMQKAFAPSENGLWGDIQMISSAQSEFLSNGRSGMQSDFYYMNYMKNMATSSFAVNNMQEIDGLRANFLAGANFSYYTIDAAAEETAEKANTSEANELMQNQRNEILYNNPAAENKEISQVGNQPQRAAANTAPMAAFLKLSMNTEEEEIQKNSDVENFFEEQEALKVMSFAGMASKSQTVNEKEENFFETKDCTVAIARELEQIAAKNKEMTIDFQNRTMKTVRNENPLPSFNTEVKAAGAYEKASKYTAATRVTEVDGKGKGGNNKNQR